MFAKWLASFGCVLFKVDLLAIIHTCLREKAEHKNCKNEQYKTDKWSARHARLTDLNDNTRQRSNGGGTALGMQAVV